MDEKKERSYAKESTKTTPSGVRFDIEKLAFVQKRENLPTKQKVVDFLLNKYWWEHKTAVPTAKEAPPLALKAEAVQDEPLSFDGLKSQIKSPAANTFFQEMDAAESLEDLEAIGRKVEASGMTWKERQQYHNYGKMKAKKFTD